MRNNFGGQEVLRGGVQMGEGCRGGQATDLFYSEDYSFSQSIINQFKSPNHSSMKPSHSNQREENRSGAVGVSGISKLQTCCRHG